MIGALLDAEGGLLRSTAQRLLAESALTVADFTRSDYATYLQAIRVLSDAGHPVDPQTVAASCRGAPGTSEQAYSVLCLLRGQNEANRQALAVYCEELRRLSALRKLQAFHRLQLAALELEKPPQPQKLLAELDAFGRACATEASTTDEAGAADLMAVLDDWDAYARGERETYLPTGIEVLDAEIRGLVQNLNVIGGAPSIGKSALADTMVLNWLARGLRVGVFGLEDGTRPIAERYLARALAIPVGDVAATRLNEYQGDRLQSAAADLHGLLANLTCYRVAGIDPEKLVATCKRWILARGVQVIVVDHGGEVEHRAATAKDRHDLAVKATYAALRNLAINHRVPILVLCHFNRDTDSRTRDGRPTLRSFAESAYIERMARVALGLWGREDRAHELRVTVLKRTKGKRDTTLVLHRHLEQSLIKNAGGHVLDEAAEAEDQRTEAESQRKMSVPSLPMKRRTYP